MGGSSVPSPHLLLCRSLHVAVGPPNQPPAFHLALQSICHIPAHLTWCLLLRRLNAACRTCLVACSISPDSLSSLDLAHAALSLPLSCLHMLLFLSPYPVCMTSSLLGLSLRSPPPGSLSRHGRTHRAHMVPCGSSVILHTFPLEASFCRPGGRVQVQS